MKYLITGTGRCGTQYAAFYLQAIGLDIRHEKVGRDGTSDWGFPRVLDFERAIHIYREPLACISSLNEVSDPDHIFWHGVIDNSPVQWTDSVLVRSMKHWLYWNRLCEAAADCNLAIENWSPLFVSKYFGIDQPDPGISKRTHAWDQEFKQLRWEDLAATNPHLTRLIRNQARRYGYQIPYEAHFDRYQHLQPA